MQVDLICDFCGKKFKRDKGAIKYRIKHNKTKGIFCSRKCAGLYRTKDRRIVLTCDYCGKEFVRTKWKIEERIKRGYPGLKTFCSNECNVVYSRERPGDKHPRWKGGRGKYSSDMARAKVAQVLGRPLKRYEIVHHINMDSTDNRNCNLLVCNPDYHKWLHWEYERRFAKELVKPVGM